uniref:Uncharacterized protein n=1 Tax=Romanomermis culicivorax TaxID=13658 RepID=A0A915JGE4_ROMCU
MCAPNPVPGSSRLYWHSHGNGTTFLKAGRERQGWPKLLPVCDPAKSIFGHPLSQNTSSYGISRTGAFLHNVTQMTRQF